MPLVGRCCPAKFPQGRHLYLPRNQRCYELVLTFLQSGHRSLYVMALENCNVYFVKPKPLLKARLSTEPARSSRR